MKMVTPPVSMQKKKKINNNVPIMYQKYLAHHGKNGFCILSLVLSNTALLRQHEWGFS